MTRDVVESEKRAGILVAPPIVPDHIDHSWPAYSRLDLIDPMVAGRMRNRTMGAQAPPRIAPLDKNPRARRTRSTRENGMTKASHGVSINA